MIALKDRIWIYRPGDTRGVFTRSGIATYMDVNGVLQTAADGVRRDGHHRAIGGRPLLLIEQARTNEFTRSEEADHADWTKANVTITADDIIGPDGTTTADKMVESAAGSASPYVEQTPATWTASVPVVVSRYVKKGTLDWFWINTAVTVNATLAWFNLDTGVKGSTSLGGTGTVERYGMEAWGNGWYRCWVVSDNVDNTKAVRTGMSDADGADTYVRSGTDYIYICGAQFEDNAEFPSSYIKTVAAVATRNAETLYIDYLAPRAATTIYVRAVELGPNVVGGGVTLMRVGDSIGTTDPRVQLLNRGTGTVGLRWIHDDGTTLPTVNVGATGLAIGSELEALCVLNANGSVQLDTSVDQAASETGSDATTADMTSGLYSDTRLYIDGSAAIAAIAVADGVGHELEDMRRFAFSPYLWFDDGVERMIYQLTPVLSGWVPELNEIADREVTLGDGIGYQLKYRTDYLASFVLKHLKATELAEVFRLKQHLLNGNTTIEIHPWDLDHSVFTVRLAPGTVPELTFDDPQNLEYGMQLAVKNTAAAAMVLRHE